MVCSFLSTLGRVGFIAAVAVSPGVATAHHHSSAARVGESFSLGAVETAFHGERAHWRQRLGYRLVDFGRTLRGRSEPSAPQELGHVRLNLISATTQVTLPSSTFFGLGAPFGHLTASSPDGNKYSAWGLGDIELLAGQVLFQRTPEVPFQLRLHATLTTPTGRYRPAAALSTSFASTAEDGSLVLSTYDSRANLGAGSWAGGGALTSNVWFGQRWQLELLTAVAAPISSTTDGIRWGADWLVRATSTFELIDDRLDIVAGPDYRHHSPDRVSVPTSDGERVNGSRRNEVGVTFGVAVRVFSPLRCRVEGHLPLWQHATRTQLVETFVAGASCEVGADL